MVDNPTPAVEVTQEDREAAAFVWFAGNSDRDAGPRVREMLDGEDDDHIAVQAFARHRIAHSRGGEVEKLREALPKRCDGKEQYAFEEWAKGERFDMNEHPLHYLFLDSRTNAARQAWCAGIAYVAGQILAALPSPPPVEIDHHQTNVMAPVEIGPVTPVEGLTSGEGVPKLKPGYPDYVDDPDGLARFREQVKRHSGHDMAICNNNSLGRLIDTIERLRTERDTALAASPATHAGSVREAEA